jgi:hypothetical protein
MAEYKIGFERVWVLKPENPTKASGLTLCFIEII